MSQGGYVVIYPLSGEDREMLERTSYVQTFRDVSGVFTPPGSGGIVLDEMNSFDADTLVEEAPKASWEVWCSVGVYETSEVWWGRLAGFDAGRVVRAPMVEGELVLPVSALLAHGGHVEKFVENYPAVVWRRMIDEARMRQRQEQTQN